MEPNFEKYYYKDFDFVPVSFCKNSFDSQLADNLQELIILLTLTAILVDCDTFDGKNMISCFSSYLGLAIKPVWDTLLT